MMYVHHALMGAESTTGPPVIRTIGVMDLKDALARGMSDFSAMPTHVFFLCLRLVPAVSPCGRLRAPWPIRRHRILRIEPAA